MIKKAKRKNTGLDSFLSEFGDRLRNVIDNHLKITHKEFADSIGLSRSYFSAILAGNKELGIEILQIILKKYPKLNPRYLFLGIGPVFIDSADFGSVYKDYVSIFSDEEALLNWVSLLSRSKFFKYDITCHLSEFFVKNQDTINLEFKSRKIDESIIPPLF